MIREVKASGSFPTSSFTEYLPAGMIGHTSTHASNLKTAPVGPSFVLPDGGISLDEAELSFVKQAIERSGGNQTKAAKLLGISRDQLRYRLQKLGDNVEDAATSETTA